MHNTSEKRRDNVVSIGTATAVHPALGFAVFLRRFWKPISLLILLLIGGMVLAILFSGGEENNQADTVPIEQISLEQQVSGLEAQLAEAVDPAVKAELEAELSVARQELADIQAELGLTESAMATLEDALAQSQTNLAQVEADKLAVEEELADTVGELSVAEGKIVKLNSELSAEISAIPTRLAAAMSYAEPRVETHFSVDETWVVERRFWWGLNDEVHNFDSAGTAVYGMIEGPTSAEWQDTTLVVTLWLPELKDAYFRLEAVNLNQNPGFLASYGQLWGDETDMSPLFEQAQAALDEVACADLGSLQEFMLRMEASVIDMAGGHDIKLFWRDKFGFTHTHQAVDDELLLASAC